MPESDVNKNLGMFMTCVQLSSNDFKMVRSTCRSAMMKYRSEPVRSLERYFIWPAQLTGYSDEKQSVHIPLLDDFLDDPLNPAIRLQFQVFFKLLNKKGSSINDFLPSVHPNVRFLPSNFRIFRTISNPP